RARREVRGDLGRTRHCTPGDAPRYAHRHLAIFGFVTFSAPAHYSVSHHRVDFAHHFPSRVVLDSRHHLAGHSSWKHSNDVSNDAAQPDLLHRRSFSVCWPHANHLKWLVDVVSRTAFV